MCTFIKWPSITNVNKLTQSDIEYIDNNYKTDWVVTEKIDGTNFSVTITKDGYKIGRRNGYLENNESFFNIQTNIKQIEHIINNIKDYYLNDYIYCILYGEYFGPKVFNRVNYGTEYQFRIFSILDITKEDNTFRDWSGYALLEKVGYIKPYLVPKLAVCSTLQEALNYPNNGNSTLSNLNNNTMEGVVISPYKFTMLYEDMSKYLFKNKNDKFLEKTTIKKSKITSNNQELYTVNELFKSYCTKSRMYSVFSKLGLPVSNSDAGKYIHAFILDAYEEFENDNKELVCTFNKSEKKAIMNIGSIGFSLFTEVFRELS